MEDADSLYREWLRKGNPPCDHPNVEREYYLGSHTGDERCTTCGATNPTQTKKPNKTTGKEK